MEISINQLAEFAVSTELGKKRIVKQQQTPDPVRIPWYQLCKARIRKFFEQNGNYDPILEGIAILSERTSEKKWQQIDNVVSREALQNFMEMKMPPLLNKFDYKSFRPEEKSIVIDGVKIIIAPDLVFRMEVEGKIFLGGVKIHVCKSKPFTLQQSQLVSSIIYRYIKENVAKPEEEVMPELCFSLDVFAKRIVQTHKDQNLELGKIEAICKDIAAIWK